MALRAQVVFFALCFELCLGQTATSAANAATYTNPVLNAVGADP